MKTARNIWSLLLLGSLAAASCSDYVEETAPQNKTVATQLALAVPQPKATRMTDAATQADETFKGMKDITLFPFATTSTAANPVATTDSRIGSAVTLGDLAVADIHAQNHSHLYNLKLNVGTNAFLVYGRSSAETTGQLAATGLGLNTGETAAQTPAGISFSPVPFVKSIEAGKAASANGDAIITYLNTIFTDAWANPANAALYSLYPMVQNMKAGADASVLAFVNKIYELLLPAKGTAVVDNVLKAILAVDELPATMPEALTALPLASGYAAFPADVKLPDGAAAIEWAEADKKFQAVTNMNNLGAMNVDVKQFAYPADLWYRTNSLVNTDDASKATYYQNETTWAGVLNAYTNKPGTVMPNTRSVAVREQLQYAVARMDVRLEAKDVTNNIVTMLKDANDALFNVADLPITGILIGQQSPVDYNFASKFAAETDPLFTIYDGNAPGAINAATDIYTHTLALETKANQKVNIAIELKNNDSEKRSIMTVNDDLAQVIPYGCKFYLVGTLDPANPKTQSSTAGGKVLAQDHATKVTFTVSDLTHAYYVIPNLNTAKLTFSLGVNEWKMSTPATAILNGVNE